MVHKSTTARGDAFEDETFTALSKLVQNGGLGLQSANCRIFQKKGYFSKDRDADIVVDISIEVWLPAAPTWSLLWICECKDYGGAIPVSDVEEFKAKIDQIAGKNVKGVIATSSSLQSGALGYARSQGLGVVRILPDSQVSWVVYFMTAGMLNERPDPETYSRALCTPGFRAENQAFFGISDGYIHESWVSLLRKGLRAPEP